MNLLEAYKNRLSIAESVYAKATGGQKMDNQRKLTVAKCLENINKFLNESFENSVGTQRSDMGLFKKFALNLTTVALPHTYLSTRLVIVAPGKMSGYITILKSTPETQQKVALHRVCITTPPLGNVDAYYTSSKVVEEKPAVTNEKVVEVH